MARFRPSFLPHPNCKLCRLHKTAHTVGVPGRLFVPCVAKNPTTAVVFVGEAPGYNEDREGQCFIGPSGEKLDSFYVHGAGLQELADIYATNTVRCKPASDKPADGEIKACLPYLHNELHSIARFYKRVLVIAVGSYAVRALTGRSLSEQFKHPLETIGGEGSSEGSGLPQLTLHATYHPAFVLRDPRQGRLVVEHLSLAREWLSTGSVAYEEMPEPIYAPRCTPDLFTPCKPLEFDLETYGAIRNERDQRHFHPIKMVAMDHKQKHNIIHTIHIAWRDPSGHLRTGWFEDRNSVHRERFWEWLRKAGTICGQNLQFDVKLIRFCHGEDKLPTWKPLQDTMVETFMLNDIHPRSLKNIVPIYRVTDYNDEPSCVKAYASPSDPKLIMYGCKDAWASYRCKEIAKFQMHQQFGDHPNACNKTAAHRYQWFSDSLWSAILMEESGVPYDTDALFKVHEESQETRRRIALEAYNDHGYLLQGKGSQESIRELFVTCARQIGDYIEEQLAKATTDEEREALSEDMKALESISTTKTGRVKTDVNTRNLLLGLAPAASNAAICLTLLTEISSTKKLIDTYTGPRLYGREAGIAYDRRIVPVRTRHGVRPKLVRIKVGTKWDHSGRLIRVYKKGTYTGVAMTYPSWFILPKADDKGSSGGVRQYRWSAKGDAVQVDPKPIKKCITSRYEQGIFAAWDYSQIEWRTAAYISRDKVMLHEIAEGLDPHLETACILLNVDLHKTSEVRKWLSTYALRVLHRCPNYKMRTEARKFTQCKPSDFTDPFVTEVVAFCRQEGGKSENFAYLFGATPSTVVRTVRVKAGFDIPMSRGTDMVRNNDRKYIGLVAYRKQSMEQARQYSAIHLPILGVSRSFSDEFSDIEGMYRGQVYDFAIQAISGLMLQSAIIELQKWRSQTRLPFHVCINNHDAAWLDIKWQYAKEVLLAHKQFMYNNWMLREVQKYFGYPFPIKAKAEYAAVRGIPVSKADQLMKELNCT